MRFRRHYNRIARATLARFHDGDQDARDGVAAGYASDPWAVFLDILRARGVEVAREQTADTGSRYASLPAYDVRLRWANHSTSAPVGSTNRNHTATTWEFSSKAPAPERAGRFASALRSLKQGD